MAVFSKYKNSFNNLINNSNVIKFLDELKLINQKSHNIFKFKNKLIKTKLKLKKKFLNKYFLNQLVQ